MKTYRVTLLMAVLFMIMGRIYADNLAVENVTISAGETKQVSIRLNNSNKKYTAFQFDLTLPEGITIAKNSNGKLMVSLERKDDHQLNVSEVGNNTYRFLAFSMTNAEFYGSSGALVSITLQASQNIGSGNRTATIKSQVFTDVSGSQAKWSDVNFTITIPVDVKVTAPTAKNGLVYTGSAQELISAGSTNVGTLKYSLDGSSYSAAIPKGTDAKAYTVYYKAVDGNKDLTTAASLTVTISPKTVSSPTITLSQTLYVYNGQERKPSVTVKDGSTTIPTSEYTVSYNNNVNVGSATVTIKDKDGGNYIVNGSAQFAITKASASITAPKVKSGLVYNGKAQELITAGSSFDGTLQYSLDGSSYSTAIPKGTDAKTYTVYYKLKGDANHNDTEPATLTATISSKTVSSPTITLSQTSYVYDGKEKKPTVTVKDGSTTIPTSEYTVSYSNNVNVGNATVTIRDKDGGNYIVNGTAYFAITDASANYTAPKAKSGLVYNGKAQELITAGSSSDGTLQYSLDGSSYSTAIPKGTDAKTYTVYYKLKGDANHNDTEPATLKVTISRASLKIMAGTYTKKEGEDNPVFTLTYEGFVNNETEAVLTKKPTVTCQATKNSPVGEYEVVVSGAQASNYIIYCYNGTLTIMEKDEETVVMNGISYICKNTTGTAMAQSVDNGLMSVVIPYAISYKGKLYEVTSIANGALSNRTFDYVSLPSTITSISSSTFYNSTLGALIWNANSSLPSSVFTNMAMLTNSNFLLYVNSKSYAPSNVSNVVVGSTANSITLKDGIDTRFYCPKAFTAQTISYTHHYGMTTGGNGKGWETIALPFNVQRIEHKTKGGLTPFALYSDMMTQRPFWLYELGSNGFRKTDAIKANTPYIIAMPNDPKYDDEYILAGDITFSATNVQVYETESLIKPSSNGKTFAPTFAVVNPSSSVYALNVSNDLTYYNGSYDAGSRFVGNLRKIYPFEAYMMTSSSAVRYLTIEFEDDATGIEEIPIMYRNEDRVKVYSLSGQLLIDSEQSDYESLWMQLPTGVYVVNGQKVLK